MKKYYKPFLMCAGFIVLSFFVMAPWSLLPPDADKPKPQDRNRTDTRAVKTDSTARGNKLPDTGVINPVKDRQGTEGKVALDSQPITQEGGQNSDVPIPIPNTSEQKVGEPVSAGNNGNPGTTNPKAFTPEPEKKPTGNKTTQKSGIPKPAQKSSTLFKHSRNNAAVQQQNQKTTKSNSNSIDPNPLLKTQNGATSIKQLPVGNQQSKSGGGSSSDSQGSWNW